MFELLLPKNHSALWAAPDWFLVWVLVGMAQSQALARPSSAAQVAPAGMAPEHPAFAGFSPIQPFEGGRLVEQRAAPSCPFSSVLHDFAEGYCRHSRDKPAEHLCEIAQDEIPGARTAEAETCEINITLSWETHNQEIKHR